MRTYIFGGTFYVTLDNHYYPLASEGDTHEVNPEPEFAVESADYGEPRYLLIKRIAQ